jgi:hypothetical protein
MLPIVPVPKVRVPCRPVSFLRLHLLVDQVEGVDVAGEVAEDRKADVTTQTRQVSQRVRRSEQKMQRTSTDRTSNRRS